MKSSTWNRDQASPTKAAIPTVSSAEQAGANWAASDTGIPIGQDLDPGTPGLKCVQIGGVVPLVIDPMALRDTPLPAIYAENQRNAIQLFYYNRRTTTELYLLDEQGALFQQRLPSTDEHFLLMQQQRFLNDILLTRNLQARNPAHRLLLDAPKFYLLDRDREGRYTAQAKAAPRHRLSDDYLELRLICDSIDLARTPHFLVCGEREFSSVEYGARLYAAVAEFILSQRRGGEAYPIYLTGLELADFSGTPTATIALFNLKKRVEQRLSEAMTSLRREPAGERPPS